MLNLKKGDVISAKELKAALGISQPTWQNNKERILLGMEDFYDFDIKETAGRGIQITIKEVYDPEIQYAYQRKGTDKADKAKTILWHHIVDKVGQGEIISGAQIARELKGKVADYAPSWIERQSAKLIKLNYYVDKVLKRGVIGHVKRTALVILDYPTNRYIEVDDEMRQSFFDAFNVDIRETHKEWSDKIIEDIYSEDSPLTEREKEKLKSLCMDMNWERAVQFFTEQYGSRPHLIRIYENGGKTIEMKDLPAWLKREIKEMLSKDE